MPSRRFVLAALTLCLPSASLTQLERRGPDQKAIEISVTEKVRVAAEVGGNDQDLLFSPTPNSEPCLHIA